MKSLVLTILLAATAAAQLPKPVETLTDAEKAAMREHLGVQTAADLYRPAILFVMAGQSNSDGAAALAAFEARDTPLPNMFQMSRGHSTNYSATPFLTFMAANQPLQRYVSANVSLTPSPGFYMARKYAEAHPESDVYILQASYSGTSFNAGNWGVGNSQYEQMVSETLHCLDEIGKTHSTVEHGGLVWQQGENDGDNQTEADAYAALLLAQMQDYRTRIGDNMPIIVGTMAPEAITSTPLQTVDAAHRALPGLLANCALSDNSDIPGLVTGFHFTAPKYRVVGARYYDAWATLTRVTPAAVSPAFVEIKASGSSLVTTPPGLSATGTLVINDGTMVFSRSPYIRVGKNAFPIGPSTQLVVCRLLNPNYGSNRTPNDALWGAYSGTGEGGSQFLAQISGTRSIQVMNLDNANALRDTTVLPTFGEWVVLAVTWDGTDQKVWQNGVVLNSSTPTNGAYPNVRYRNVDFGQSYNSGTRLEAEVRLARLYNRVLTAQEMNEVLNEFRPSETVDLSSGLVADWRFSDLTDSSGNGNTLTTSGTAPTLSGGAAVFNATGHYVTPITQSVSWTRAIRFKSAAGTGYLMAASGNWGIYLDSGVVKAGAPSIVGTNLADDAWHLAVLCYDATKKVYELWVDGSLVQGIAGLTTSGDGSALLIGAQTSGNRFTGSIDRIRVWNRALNVSEIMAL